MWSMNCMDAGRQWMRIRPQYPYVLECMWAATEPVCIYRELLVSKPRAQRIQESRKEGGERKGTSV